MLHHIIPNTNWQLLQKMTMIIVTHEDSDHISGILELMEDMKSGGIQVGALILPNCSDKSKSENYQTLIDTANEAGVDVLYIENNRILISTPERLYTFFQKLNIFFCNR